MNSTQGPKITKSEKNIYEIYTKTKRTQNEKRQK